MRFPLASVALIGAPLLVLAEGAPPPAEPPKGDRPEQVFYDRYAIIVERNIFSKNRPHVFRRPGSSPAQESRREAPPPPPLEKSFVLTGIVMEKATYSAFVEDTRQGMTQKLKTSEAIARGKIKEIGIDHMVYEVGERTTRIELGQNLAGGASNFPARSEPSSSSAPSGPPEKSSPPATETKPAEAKPGEPGAPAAAPAGAEDPIERLRRRRLEEMKK